MIEQSERLEQYVEHRKILGRLHLAPGTSFKKKIDKYYDRKLSKANGLRESDIPEFEELSLRACQDWLVG